MAIRLETIPKKTPTSVCKKNMLQKLALKYPIKSMPVKNTETFGDINQING